jgi:hypothetical protein
MQLCTDEISYGRNQQSIKLFARDHCHVLLATTFLQQHVTWTAEQQQGCWVVVVTLRLPYTLDSKLSFCMTVLTIGTSLISLYKGFCLAGALVFEFESVPTPRNLQNEPLSSRY